jgi:hypothetical protein
MEILLRVTANNFCAGAIFNCDPPICTEVADRLQSFIGHGLHKCLTDCTIGMLKLSQIHK